MGGGWAWSFKDKCQAVSIKSSFAAPQETTIFGQALFFKVTPFAKEPGKGINDGD